MNHNKKYFRAVDKLQALEQAWMEKIAKDPDFRALQRLRQKTQDMLTNCPHEETTVKNQYREGSYLDRASTETWTECVLCRRVLSEHIETHDWYG